MAKKTVINDFSALKGKVNFQEQKPVVPETKPSVRPASATTAKESSLKIGQSVVLMDSDLRGRIVSIGRKVGIELEDGLVIEASYGEFAVTSLSELSSLKETKVKAKKDDVRKTSSSGALITRQRYREALYNTINYLSEFSFDKEIELSAEDIRLACREIGKITGRIEVDEILDKIFGSFCIGK